MNHQKKEDRALSAMSFIDFLGEVLGLEQAERTESLADLKRICGRIDAHRRKSGKPAEFLVRELRELKNLEKPSPAGNGGQEKSMKIVYTDNFSVGDGFSRNYSSLCLFNDRGRAYVAVHDWGVAVAKEGSELLLSGYQNGQHCVKTVVSGGSWTEPERTGDRSWPQAIFQIGQFFPFKADMLLGVELNAALLARGSERISLLPKYRQDVNQFKQGDWEEVQPSTPEIIPQADDAEVIGRLQEMATNAYPLRWSSADVREGNCRLEDCHRAVPDAFYDADEILGLIFSAPGYKDRYALTLIHNSSIKDDFDGADMERAWKEWAKPYDFLRTSFSVILEKYPQYLAAFLREYWEKRFILNRILKKRERRLVL